ncbi:hypothetical protein BD410DRAFT_813480 [Rickenella mellea]|uniref:Actin-like ATPase domain-containing protein n=1 Tax=Rickenella mellea TaxID=50990 RepID=A0A4Y7QFY5_9AGAM|nr:hypothetical protein BD410DRAFT_813480 [Rickenella mellea]
MSSSTINRRPYSGTRTSLVIAIDVGTTFSGVSYAVLRPGEVPFIQGVTRFPDQGRIIGDKKVPSVLFYDDDLEVRAAGASTEDPNVISDAEDEGWRKVEHFKLHLRPTSMRLETNGLKLGSIPLGKTATEVFGDFLAYLYQSAVSFIKEAHVDGPALWKSVEEHVEFVLSHPNGWEGHQQQLMRMAAVYGGLVPDSSAGRGRVRFVSEGEASLHSCLANGLGPETLEPGNAFIIADAGGGTLDISTYEICATMPLKIQELAPPDCRFAGSVFVNRSAQTMLQEKLQGSRYDTPSAMDFIIQEFDRTTKRLFSNPSKVQWVTVGGPGERNNVLGVRSGKLKLDGTEVAKCFEFSVQQAVDAIKQQKETTGRDKIDVWLVGGFAASPWLFDQLKTELGPHGINIYRPDTNTSKAVADGAVGYYLDRWVTARVAKLSCGTNFCTDFDPKNSEHTKRKSATYRQPSGRLVVPNQFYCFVAKGTKVSETSVVKKGFFWEITSPSTTAFQTTMLSYNGDLPVPHWMDTKPSDQFKNLCTIDADLSPLCRPSTIRRSPATNEPYWRVDFEIEVKFGLTEYEARIQWVEDVTPVAIRKDIRSSLPALHRVS